MSNNLDLDLTKNKKFIMSNDAINGKQTMTLKEAKLIRLLVMQVSMKDRQLMEYKADIKEIARCLGIDSSNLYRDVQKVCEKLTGRKLGIKTDNPKNPWKYIPWMSIAEYDGEGILIIGLNERIRPFVIELNELFTQYEMIDILNINSFYALRIYELLKKEFTKCNKVKHVFEFTIQELREITDTEDKFQQIGHFRDKVINISEREINEKTDLNITVDSIKMSRRFIGFKFTIQEKSKIKIIKIPAKSIDLVQEKQIPVQVQEDQMPGQINIADVYELKAIMESSKIPCSQSQAEKLFTAYSYDLERFKRNLNYVICRGGEIIDPVAYLFSAKDDDVSPKAELPKPKKAEKSKSKKKDHTETISKERIQAYLDMEVNHAVDLWPDLPIIEK